MKMKRILSLVLAAAMLLAAFAVSASAEETTTSAKLEDVLVDTTAENPAGYSTVYYGGIPWMVLDKEFSDGQAEPKNGIYLLSKYAYGYGTFWNAHYGPGDYVWHRTGIFTRLDVLYHPDGYNGDPGNTSPTNLGYQASDIRKYMTGIGDYEAVYPRSMHEHGNPDNSGLNVSSYFWKTKVTYDTPVDGVEYYVKGEFKLSTDENNNYETLAVTAADWLPDTWYTYDAATRTYNLLTEAPAEGESVVCYHDATEYYNVGELTSFEAGKDYYTFEKISAGQPEWAYTKLEMQADSRAKGALYCAFSVTDMKNSTSADAEGEGRVILSGKNNRSFASDMGFSAIEKAAVLPVNRAGYTNGGAKTPSLWTYKNSGAYSDEFVGDTYFLPTAADLNTYLDDNGISKATTFANGDAAQYWLSSMLRYDRVGMVDGGGGEWYQHPTFKSLGIRPAFNLNPEAVLAYIPVADNAYRMVMADADKSDFAVTKVTMNGTVATVEYNGAVVGKDEYISCVAKNESGKVYYTKGVKAPAASGTVEIDLAETGATGELSLCFINETYNGELATSYAKNVSDTFGATIFYTEPDEDETTDNTIQGVVETVADIAEAGEYVIVVKGDRTEDVKVIEYINDQKIAIVGDAGKTPVIDGNFLVNGENKPGTAFILKNIIFNNSEAMPAVAMFARNVVYTVDVSNVASSLIENVVIANKENGISFAGVSSAVVTDTTIDVSGNAVYVGSGANVSITSGTYNGAVEVASDGKLSITGGLFSDNVSAYVASGYELTRTADGYLVVKDGTGNPGVAQADSISIEYKDITAADAEGEKTYEVYVKANDEDMINELASADLTFDFKTEAVKGGAMNITVLPTADFTMSTAEGDRYMFNYNGVSAFEGTANAIAIATIKVEGYGKFSIATKDLSTSTDDTNIVNATTLKDNLVDSYTAAGADDTDATTGALVINTDTVANDGMVGSITNGAIAVPTRELTINVAFPNAVEDNVVAYQDMMIEITGNIDGVNKTVVYNLGEDVNAMTNGAYVVTEDRLVLNNAYTVTVSGAGYRTARYTVTMTNDKELNFWNNVMDEDKLVEKDKATSNAKVTFLAGDIVKDNNINIYDLSAVVSYFATSNETDKESDYAKYDLNRDGVIDSKDVAYVLVSWNN